MNIKFAIEFACQSCVLYEISRWFLFIESYKRINIGG
jgi:hypothetical protein